MHDTKILTHATPLETMRDLGDLHVSCEFSWDCAARLKRQLIAAGWLDHDIDHIPAAVLLEESHHALREPPTDWSGTKWDQDATPQFERFTPND